MCHATEIRTEHADYRRHFRATVEHGVFADLYRRRLSDPSIRIPKAVDDGFLRSGAADDPIVKLIDAYQSARTQNLERALFAERSNLTESSRLAACDSMVDSVESRHRVASPRIQQLIATLAETNRASQPHDARVHCGDIAPVAVCRDGRTVMVPMRYQAYPNPDTISYRHRARLKGVFGVSHGLLLANAFFEKLSVPDREIGEADGEAPSREVEVRFAPLSAEPMLLACVWWQPSTADALPGFTILMDLPPPEISCAGHDRCVIPVALQHVDSWLRPNGDVKLAEQILDARVRPYFESERLSP